MVYAAIVSADDSPVALIAGLWVTIFVVMLGYVIGAVAWESRTKKRRAERVQWLDARPTRTAREEALQAVAEAFADTRINPAEHETYVEKINVAKQNRVLEEIKDEVAEVKKPK